MHLSRRSNFARKLKVRYTVSEKFQTVSFDLYSSVMGITGLGPYGGPQQNLRRVRVAREVFLATGLAVFLVLTGIQLLRLVFAVRLSLQNGIHVPVRTFCAATISGFLLAMGLLPYSILLAKVLWIAAVAAQIFLTCTFRRWLIDQLDTHEISPVWLIPMVGNASPAFAGVDLGFPGLSKMLLFSALLCWALLCRLSSGVSCLFVLLPRRRPCPARYYGFSACGHRRRTVLYLWRYE